MALSSARPTTQTIYGPVDSANKEIRLLKIVPSNTANPTTIECFLTPACMRDAPTFIALSYTWGQPDPDCHIQVNSSSLRITKNLLRFLLQIRQFPSYADQYFWIDAVCIDQSNIEERSQQVGLMSSIYSSAAVVVLWLGPAYENSDLAMHALVRTGNTIQSRNPGSGTTMLYQDTQSAKLWRKGEGAAIRQLCERRYWTRLWVLQELALADGRITIICGGKQLRWTDFTTVMRRLLPPLFRKRSEVNYAYEGLLNSPGRAMSIQVLKTSARSTLYDQVMAARHLNCLDPRDRVYGVIGIARVIRPGLDPLRADYSLTLVQVAHRVVQHDLAVRPAASLYDVRQRTQMLAEVFGIPVDEILSTRDLLPMAVVEYPVQHEQTGIDVLWAMQLKLWEVVKLWLSVQGSHQISDALDSAISRKATAAIEGILGLWQQYSFAVNMYATRCGNTRAFTFKMDTDATCMICKEACHYKTRRNDFGLDPFTGNSDERPILYQAMLENNRAITLMVLAIDEAGLEGTEVLPPALHVAVSVGDYCDYEIIRLLMDRTDVNQRALSGSFDVYQGMTGHFQPGDTPLLAASKSWSPTGIKALLGDPRTNVNLKDDRGNTALYYVMNRPTEFDNGEVCAMLLGRENIDVHTVFHDGGTALHLASWISPISTPEWAEKNAAHMQYLLGRGLDTNAPDEKGLTPLHLASLSGNLLGISLLIKNAANVNAADKDMMTPLHHVDFDNPGAITLLIDNGADVKAKDKDLKTPLHYIAELSDGELEMGEVMRRMLQLGADVNAVDKDGKTPLHYCVENGAQAVKTLLSLGADPHLRDGANERPGDSMPEHLKRFEQDLQDNPQILDSVDDDDLVRWNRHHYGKVVDINEARQVLANARRDPPSRLHRSMRWLSKRVQR